MPPIAADACRAPPGPDVPVSAPQGLRRPVAGSAGQAGGRGPAPDRPGRRRAGTPAAHRRPGRAGGRSRRTAPGRPGPAPRRPSRRDGGAVARRCCAVRRACLVKVTCSAWEESRPPIWESRPGPAAQRRQHPRARRQRREAAADGLPGVPGGQGAGHRPLAVVGRDQQPAGGGVHLVAAQRAEDGHRRRPGQGQRAPGDRAEVLGVLTAHLGQRAQLELGRIGLRRGHPRQRDPAVPGDLAVERDGRRLPAACGGQRVQPRLAQLARDPARARGRPRRAAATAPRTPAGHPAGARRGPGEEPACRAAAAATHLA